jgi:large subunit ribosomal protein L28
MARVCELCGKKTVFGMSFARRGLAKAKGGVGRKVTGHDRRTFKPNVQRIRVVVGNAVRRMRICTQCLRGQRYVKPAPRRGAKQA